MSSTATISLIEIEEGIRRKRARDAELKAQEAEGFAAFVRKTQSEIVDPIIRAIQRDYNSALEIINKRGDKFRGPHGRKDLEAHFTLRTPKGSTLQLYVKGEPDYSGGLGFSMHAASGSTRHSAAATPINSYSGYCFSHEVVRQALIDIVTAKVDGKLGL
jgi:hypothetical protein